MAARLFSTFKRVKTVTVGVYGDFLATADGSIPHSWEVLPIYMDLSGDTSFVMPLPGHVRVAFGEWVKRPGSWRGDFAIRIEKDAKTGTDFIRSKASVDAIKETFDDVMRMYQEHAQDAVRKRVIVISAWCYSPRTADRKEILFESGRGLFMTNPSKEPIVKFDYRVRWMINKEFYRQDDPEFPPQHWPAHEFGVSKVMDWSEELEQACQAFKSRLELLSSNLAEFLSQEPERLADALLTSAPRLTFQSNAEA